MLKKFILQTLSSFVGAWIALGLFCVAIFCLVVGIVSRIGSETGENSIKEHTVITITLSGEIVETETKMEPDYNSLLNGSLSRPTSLSSLVSAIKAAEENDDVEMMYIKCNGVSAAPATLNALREEIVKFKQSGKKIYAYGDAISNADYFVASAADSLFLNKGGMLNLTGLGSTTPYFKSLFDKLGVSFQVVKVGTFKSAVEPYIMDEMSQPARAQLDTLFGVMWKYMRDEMSSTRKGVTPEAIDSAISSKYISFAASDEAVKLKLVDRTVYERQMDGIIASALDVDKEKVNFVSAEALMSDAEYGSAYSSKKQIAVLYATGEIADGASTGINFETLVPLIIKLAEDDNVKGMVLRVNSPGGSAFGSEQIGEALDYFQAQGKPLAVSMGDYAASGGYWISCCADRIFADPLTITGSIGIFGLIPNVSGLASKLGVNMETVRTNPGADFPTFFKPMDEKQLEVMQSYVDRGYDTFVGRVAKGRKMKESRVREIAEGRVWSALTAVKIGLVDSIGSLENAVDWTAKKAQLGDSYDTAIYPKFEPSFWDMLPTSDNVMYKTLSDIAAGKYEALMMKAAAQILGRKPIQMRMMPIEVRL